MFFLKLKTNFLYLTRFFPLHKINLPGVKILAYHGICPDNLSEKEWIPSHFVRVSEFKKQMAYVSEYLKPISLRTALKFLQEKQEIPPKTVVITFDDGYANNFHLAFPILKKYKIPATIFLSTRYIEKQELFPFDKIRLLKYWGVKSVNMSDYLNNPISQLHYQLAQIWPNYENLLTEQQWKVFRPLIIDEIRKMRSSNLIEFGAHTHSHCILRNESIDTREKEIITSIKKVKEMAGNHEVPFSYPNGQFGDFDEKDKLCVKRFCYCAVSGIPGSNYNINNLFELRRYSVGLYHSLEIFKLEISGIRQIVLHFIKRK